MSGVELEALQLAEQFGRCTVEARVGRSPGVSVDTRRRCGVSIRSEGQRPLGLEVARIEVGRLERFAIAVRSQKRDSGGNKGVAVEITGIEGCRSELLGLGRDR